MRLLVTLSVLLASASVPWWAGPATAAPKAAAVAVVQPAAPSVLSPLHLWREIEALARERIVIRRPQAAHAFRPRTERLSCKLGTEDRHARIAVELTGGRVKSIAYYSKWKPRTCSVHIVRDDSWSVWQDTGHTTLVTLNEEKGAFLIDHQARYVKFLFRDIDRERFCGMEGKITGSLTVTRGSSRCALEGVMDEN